MRFLSLVVTSYTIDFLQEGRPFAKGAIIISDEAQVIAQAVLERLDRGVTVFRGRGGYTGNDKETLFVVVDRHQIHHLAALVREMDPKAFMVITEVTDVFGEGFERAGRR